MKMNLTAKNAEIAEKAISFLCSTRSLRLNHSPVRTGRRAFTLLEMLVVITVIGLLATLALPHLGGMNKSNSMAAATQQLIDDVALARQRAMANRTVVYMVFLPTNYWAPIAPPTVSLSTN